MSAGISNIEIDSAAVNMVVSKAIIEGMSEEAKERVLQQAVESLIAVPKREHWERDAKPTPLQHAFNVAVNQAAVDVVREMVDEGELKERIRALVREKVVEALTSDSPLATRIGIAVGEVVANVLSER